MTGFALGPFDIDTRIGEGGMGEVYRAFHRETDLPVAIKVLTSRRARQPRYQRDFRQEAQALAKLHHPAIASIADYGTIGADLATRQPVAEGAPWFAMEYVDGVAIKHLVGDWTWEQLEGALLTLLDALAHAHAHQIIHRDLKPSNILVGRLADGEIGLKLVDFGVAHLHEVDAESGFEGGSERVTGTPAYMAPEQIRGRWRDQGPWTDLYALACLTWRLVCGRAPFHAETTREVLEGHAYGRPNDFDPQMAVPDGLEGWLRQLLIRDPTDRVRRAADAAWGLMQLGAASDLGDEAVGGGVSVNPGSAAGATVVIGSDELTETVLLDEPPEVSAGDPADGDAGVDRAPPADQMLAEPPPMVANWQRQDGNRAASPIPGAGLRLFGLRTVPVVDRETSRDQLWSQLQDVHERREPAAVLLEGPAGTGKSRVAEWLYRRAHETGAARVLRAMHTPTGGEFEGMAGMILNAFRAWGLERDELYERLTERLPPLETGDAASDDELHEADARALTELVYPTDDDAESVVGPRYRFASPRQIQAVVGRLFRRLAGHRPLMVWFDDLHWGSDALGVVESLWAPGIASPPVLVVGTVRSDVLAEQPRMADRVETLGGQDRCTRIEMPPLERRDHRRLIERLLDMDRALVETLTERTEGNPLFAVQLLQDWVDRGRIEAGSDGFRVPQGADIEVPDDIHSLWMSRLGRLVDDVAGERPDDVWWALELAAALGREVDRREWDEVCGSAEVQIPARLVDVMVQRGLARRSEEGWRFAHGLLVDSLKRCAVDEGRWADHHRRCAEMLEKLYPDRPDETAGRRADHWTEAGDLERALEPLLAEAERYMRQGDAGQRREVLKRREQILAILGVPPDDARQIENDVRLGERAFMVGETERATARAEEAFARAEKLEDPRLKARSARLVAVCHQRRGRRSEARRWYDRAADWARALGPHPQGKSFRDLGRFETAAGNLEEASTYLARALDRLEEAGERHGQLWVLRNQAWLTMLKGDVRRAAAQFEDVLEEARAEGFRGIELECLNGLGEVARFEGEFERAREFYRRYRRLARETGRFEEVAVGELNLAQVELGAGRWSEAGERLAEAEKRLDRMDAAAREHLVALIRLTLACGRGRWSIFDDLFEPYADGWPDRARLIKDHPWLLEMAGGICREADEDERARRIWALTRDLWAQLGDEEAVERVEECLRKTS